MYDCFAFRGRGKEGEAGGDECKGTEESAQDGQDQLRRQSRRQEDVGGVEEVLQLSCMLVFVNAQVSIFSEMT